MNNCSECKYGDINFWGYDECWKFDHGIDFDVTRHIATREKQALKLNYNNQCPYFEKYKAFQKLKDFSNNILYSIIKL